mmetsp:Transcript_16506/g.41952  ORF Transcript_16506/g.41952 Transcript_16506/m.41952 type:complete len:448 (+) Transcript_16506:1-1344(+)
MVVACRLPGATGAQEGDAATHVRVGSRVRRGPDWVWFHQDGGGPGTVVELVPWKQEPGAGLRVRWDRTGDWNVYRWNAEDGKFDLELLDEPLIPLHQIAWKPPAPADMYCSPQQREALLALYWALNGPNWTFQRGWSQAAEQVAESPSTQSPRRPECAHGQEACTATGDEPPQDGEMPGAKASFQSQHKSPPSDLYQSGLPGRDETQSASEENHAELVVGAGEDSQALGSADSDLTSMQVKAIPAHGAVAAADAWHAESNRRGSGYVGEPEAAPYTAGATGTADNSGRTFHSNNDPCTLPWTGITCRRGKVISIKLDQNMLEGELPLSPWASLKHLESIDLSMNRLRGPLPSTIGEFLTELRFLELKHNQLSGPIPGWLGNLKHLTWLGLANNQFSGHVPAELSRLHELEYLFLSHNALSITRDKVPLAVRQLRKLASRHPRLEGNL